MNVIIFGAGRRGLRLARHLIEEKKSVTFLDNSPARCALAQSKLDCMAVCGSAIDIAMLEECGCQHADIVVAVTDSDEVNLVSCGIVTSRWPDVRTIATIRGLTYMGQEDERPFSLLGIDHIVNPEQEAAERIKDIITSGLFSDIAYFPGAHYMVVTRTVTRGDILCDKSLVQIKKRYPGRYLIAGVNHRGKVSTPNGNTVLREGDEIALILDDDEADSLYKLFDISNSGFKLRRIILVGATRIARFLLKGLDADMRRNITLVEKDREVCKSFSELFPDILILNGAITDENFWDEENLSNGDLFVSMTDNDELNVLISSYAKTQGNRRSIALIKTNTSYVKLAKAIGVDATVSTTESTVDAIMKILRGENVKTLHAIFDGRIEVYEYVIKPSYIHLGKALKDINFRSCAMIAGVSRGDDNFIPDGSYAFQAGDTVLVVALHEDYDFVQSLFGSSEDDDAS